MKRSVRTVIIAALSIGLLAVFLRGVHLGDVWAEIREAGSLMLAISTATTVLTMVVRAIRWQYLLEPIGRVRFRPAFRTTTIGFAANAVLPARPGEVIRPYLLARQEGLSATSTFATIIVERVLDSVTVVLLLASFVLFFDPGMAAADSAMYHLVRIGGMTVGAATLALLGLLFFAAGHPGAMGRWALQLEHLLPGRLAHKIAALLQSFAEGLAIVRAPSRLLIALALSLAVWLTIVLGIWTVALAFHIDMPFTGSFLMLALTAVGVSIPTPGNVGAFEAAVQIGLKSFYAVPNDRAVGAALVLHAVSVLPTIALGVLFLIQDGIRWGDMGELAHVATEGDTP